LNTPELIDCDIALDPKRNRHSTWKKARDRMIDEVWPETTPSFQIHSGAKIFTIGSCFARNIEEHLYRLGFKIPTLEFRVPREEWAARANGILNKYTPAAIFQEIEWARNILLKGGKVTESDSAPFLYECTEGACIDTNLGGFVPVTRERFFERRSQVYNTFKEAFSADYVVMTLGLVEAWFDREKGLYIHEYPKGKNFARNRERFGFQTLSYNDCREFIQRTIDAIRSVNKEVKFLITTSPVPLSRTFTDKDVIIANTYSKSLLRTVAGDVATANKHVDYFPSYESVMLTKNWNVWGPDLLHVADPFVGKVVARLTDTYCSGLEESKKTFLQSYINIRETSVLNALELGRQAVEDSPQRGELRKHYGNLLIQSRAFQEAQRQFEAGIALTPADAMLHFRLSEVMALQGQVTEAIKAAKRSTELAPDNELLHRHLARLWVKKLRFGKAVAQFALAIGYRRLIKTRRPGMKRFFRFVLPRLQRTSRDPPV
jgi:tetratricopeptide (TPR) repeat protein